MFVEDTICALATLQGSGALGIIRISGIEAITIVNSIFKGKNLEKAKSHTINYGYIIDDKGNIIDEVMLSIFLSPKTFTTENMVEITCHASSYIEQEILSLLVSKGCRLAQAGEFTQRAFLHGRIDLSQAEAVADLITSENEAAHKMALSQMRGGFSSLLKELRVELLNLASLLELELDFSEEDIEFVDRKQILNLIDHLLDEINPLIQSFSYGNAIKKGVPVVILGRPNSGKSTLLNTLLQEDRAIVSEIAGTTRDIIEEVLIIDGINFRFIDTAGLRQTEDQIEAIGVDRALEKARQASIVVYLMDLLNPDWEAFEDTITQIEEKNQKIIIGLNKIDQLSEVTISLIPENIRNKYSYVLISAKENQQIDQLKEIMFTYIKDQKADNVTVVNNVRHLNALMRARNSLILCKEGIENGLSSELVAIDLRQALEALGEITGEISNDEILGNIFSKFCIGK